MSTCLQDRFARFEKPSFGSLQVHNLAVSFPLPSCVKVALRRLGWRLPEKRTPAQARELLETWVVEVRGIFREVRKVAKRKLLYTVVGMSWDKCFFRNLQLCAEAS